MSKVAFMMNEGLLTVVLDRPRQVRPEHPFYKEIKKLLGVENAHDKIRELLDSKPVEKAIAPLTATVAGGKVVVRDGEVLLDGKPVHNTISKRIQQFLREGLPFDGLVKFLERLAANPSYQSQQELYDFLEHKDLPITDDGHFLAYKAIDSNWMDKYTHTISNAVGQTVSMNRGLVDDNRDVGCSKGLHCGALDYVLTYGNGDDRIVIVKVDPADAVSVPKDCSYQKLRVCKYSVIREFERELTKPLYTAEAASYDSYDEDDYEEDDCFDEGEVVSASEAEMAEPVVYDDDDDTYGVKPSGQRYFNKRLPNGRFGS